VAVHEFRVSDPYPRKTSASIAVLAPQRGRLAIVSTRNKLCGIAAYTKALERQLADLFDITVFDLDQYLLRGRHPRVRTLGDRHIKEICRELAAFDVVSLQIEFGTLGDAPKDIERRFRWLVTAAPRLSVTFHSLNRPPVFPLADFLRSIATFNWAKAIDIQISFAHGNRLSVGIAKILRRAQRRKPTSVIVHNRRDRSDAQYLHGFHKVFDHPLSFLSPDEAETVILQATRRKFPQLDPFPNEAKFVGVFGFLSDYKGFEVVIKALYHLPGELSG
jgi:glycosyltransferase involved in cell wall biosynthesis